LKTTRRASSISSLQGHNPKPKRQDQIGRNCRCAFRKCLFEHNGTETVMHTDRKIGFAMGILLIGIFSALIFRN
jgi:hypothetical protein